MFFVKTFVFFQTNVISKAASFDPSQPFEFRVFAEVHSVKPCDLEVLFANTARKKNLYIPPLLRRHVQVLRCIQFLIVCLSFSKKYRSPAIPLTDM